MSGKDGARLHEACRRRAHNVHRALFLNSKFKTMKTTEISNELFAINEAINEHLKFCESVAQLATLATLQEHFVNLAQMLNNRG